MLDVPPIADRAEQRLFAERLRDVMAARDREIEGWADRQSHPFAPGGLRHRPVRPVVRADLAVGRLAQCTRALRETAYRQVGANDRPDWAMSQVARSEGMGLPIGP